MIEYTLFCVVLLYTAQWSLLNLLLGSLGAKKFPITIVHNDSIRQLIKNKTGIEVKTIKISESNSPFGMMIGIPTKPQLLLSRILYDTFTPDELEYVVLHEVGHYYLWHTVTELAIGIILFVDGIVILGSTPSLYKSVPTALLLGLVFGVIMVRLGRLNEYQADAYSLRHMTNPRGMVLATNKFKSHYKGNRNKIIEFLFYRGNPFDNRIKMAEAEIERRKTSE